MKGKLPLDTIFILKPEAGIELGIPTMITISGREELWKYVKLDRNKDLADKRKYLISSYGRVFNLETNKMLYPSDSWKSNVAPYKAVTLYDGERTHTYMLHRLVALAFIERTDEDELKERIFVNHKDGNPSHNYEWNLEWVTGSENMFHAVNTGLWKLPLGENRSTAKWTDKEIHFICGMIAEGHKATYIYRVLMDVLKDPEKVQYERVRTLYKHIIKNTHWKHISRLYDIDHTSYNYAKENASVTKKQAKATENKKVTGGV